MLLLSSTDAVAMAGVLYSYIQADMQAKN